MKFSINNHIISLKIHNFRNLEIVIDNEVFEANILEVKTQYARIKLGKREIYVRWSQIDNNIFHIVSEGKSFISEVNYVLPQKIAEKDYKRNIIWEIKAPVSGLISKIFVQPESKIHKGQRLLSLNAMKMENEIQSPVDGIIKELKITENKEVNKNDILLTILQK